jgi:L-ribulose-5-phosphate 4-epimerase
MSSYQHLKEECYLANLALPEHKLIDLTFGNVSVADPSKGVFAIKPSGVTYDTLKAEDMVIVDLEKGEVVEGKLRFSSDTPTHRRLFQAFGGEVRSVVHTHSRNAVAWAQAGRGIPCFGTTHADYFYGEVPVTRPMTQEEIQSAYEWETGNVIVERFRNIDPAQVCAVLVHGHGPFAWGPSGKKAVENALALEIVAEMAMKAMQINPAAQPISQNLLDKHFLRKHGPGAYYGQKSA